MTRTGKKKARRRQAPAAPSPVPATTPATRRSFLGRIWLGLSLAAAAEAVWVALSFVRPGKEPARDGGIVVAGPEASFEAGSVTAFPNGRFYLVRLEDGGFLALDRRCTHLGCTVPWDAEARRFACPCHASSFDIRGELLAPPAPRPLDLFEVRIENGIVKVDTTSRRRRTRFEPAQVTRS